MSSYTWDSFPLHGTTNFELVARTALEGWRSNGYGMEVRLNEIENGSFFTGLSTPLIPSSAIISIDPGLLADGTVPVTKLEVGGTQADGAVAVYRDGIGWSYEVIEGVVGGDTYQIKWDSIDTASFLGSKVATDAELIAGASTTKLVTPAGLKQGGIASSVNHMGVVSGSVSISPTHGTHTLELSGNTLINLTGFTDPSVHYTLLVVLRNASHTVSWSDSVRWPGNRASDLQGGRFKFLLSTYDGGSNFDISEALEYA